MITWPLLDTTWVWNVDFGLVLEWRCKKTNKHGSLQNQFFWAKERCPGLQCAVCTIWAIHTNNTIKKKQTTDKKESLWKLCWPWKGPFVPTGLPEVDIIGGICGNSIAKTKPKSFFNAIVEAPVSILVEVNSVSVEVFLCKEFVGKEKRFLSPLWSAKFFREKFVGLLFLAIVRPST